MRLIAGMSSSEASRRADDAARVLMDAIKHDQLEDADKAAMSRCSDRFNRAVLVGGIGGGILPSLVFPRLFGKAPGFLTRVISIGVCIGIGSAYSANQCIQDLRRQDTRVGRKLRAAFGFFLFVSIECV
jgi:hypothetical protein